MAKINPKTAKAMYKAGMEANKEKIAKERYGEFGFDTLTYDQQQEVYKNYPKLPRSSKDIGSDFETPAKMETPLEKEKDPREKVKDTIRVSNKYKPGEYVEEFELEDAIKKQTGKYPQLNVEDYSTVKKDKKGFYVTKLKNDSGINMGSALYAKLSASCKAAARKKFDVYPSAYANMWASKQQKKGKC